MQPIKLKIRLYFRKNIQINVQISEESRIEFPSLLRSISFKTNKKSYYSLLEIIGLAKKFV